MNHRRIPALALALPCLLAAGGASATARDLGTTKFVEATVLRLRAAPAMDADVSVRLRVNTRVEVLAERAEWAQVGIADAPEFSGWAPKAFLRDTPVSTMEALDAAHAASEDGDGAGALMWAERALAIDGTGEEAYLALRYLYAKYGESDRAAAVDHVLNGEGTTYIAACRSGEAMLLGSYSDEDGLLPLVTAHEVPGLDIDKNAAARAVSLASRMSTLSWFAYSKDGTVRPLQGTPFVAPRMRATLDVPEEFDPGTEGKLVLGACDEDGALLTTSPLVAPTHARARVAGLGQVRVQSEAASSAIRFGTSAFGPGAKVGLIHFGSDEVFETEGYTLVIEKQDGAVEVATVITNDHGAGCPD